MIKRLLKKTIQLCWYTSIVFMVLLSGFLMEAEMYVSSYISLFVMAVMVWISAVANK